MSLLVEERCYKLKAAHTPAQFLDIYQSTGAMELQVRLLGNMIGYFVTEIGDLNSIVHLWGYESMDDRARRRAQLREEPLWQDYLRQILPMLDTMTNRILLPTSFSPIR